jgi:hypothetical protein
LAPLAWALLFLICALGPAPARGAEVDVECVVAPGDWLLAEVRADGLFDSEILDALHSGLPARLRYQIELWRARSSLWDQLVYSERFEYRIHYDVLAERYRIFEADGAAILESGSLAEIQDLLSHEEVELQGLEELDENRRYYAAVEIRWEPLSIEEIRDLERWLRGSVSSRDKEGGIAGISGHLIGILRNEVGLGGRSTRGRSRDFEPDSLREARSREDDK